MKEKTMKYLNNYKRYIILVAMIIILYAVNGYNVIQSFVIYCFLSGVIDFIKKTIELIPRKNKILDPSDVPAYYKDSYMVDSCEECHYFNTCSRDKTICDKLYSNELPFN